MGADHQLATAAGQILFQLAGRGRAGHARQDAGLYTKSRKPFGKDAAMLAGQQGCRGNQRNLIASHYRHKSRPQGHFSLAKTHIAANQPVCGLARG